MSDSGARCIACGRDYRVLKRELTDELALLYCPEHRPPPPPTGAKGKDGRQGRGPDAGEIDFHGGRYSRGEW